MTFWPLTNSDFPTEQTFYQFHDNDTALDFHRIMSVFHKALQRVWHASRERLPPTPGSVPSWGLACALIVETSFQMYPLNLRSKTRRRATLLLTTWICTFQSVGTVIFALHFTTNVTISISILQTFRSWVASTHLLSTLVFLSHNSSDTPGIAPLMDVLFWGRCDFPISFSGRDMSRNLSQMIHDILDDDHIQYHPPLIGHYTNFWPLLIWNLLPNLTFYLIVQSFHRTYATGAACQQGTLTPPDSWSCPTFGTSICCTCWDWRHPKSIRHYISLRHYYRT